MPAVSTCLWFDSQALEAAEFYVSIVPNSRITSVMRDPGGNPHTTAGQVLYVEFELDGQRFGGLNGGPAFVLDEAASVVLTCATQEEADALWDGFTAEGTPSQCGWLTDAFGLSWQIVPERVNQLQMATDPSDSSQAEAARRAVQAMMGMRRLDSACMERIAAGPSGYAAFSPGPGDAPSGPVDSRLDRIERTVWIDATPEAVWQVVSEPGWWVNGGALRPHEIRSSEGRHEVTDPEIGTFTVSDEGSDPGRYIAYRWEQSSPEMNDDTGLHTLTQFWALPDRDGTRVVVIETGFRDAGLPDDRLREAYDGNVHGWDIELSALRDHLGR